jgi:2-dehydropantoate 2-reductase
MKNIADEIFEVIKKSGYSTHWNTSENYLETFYKTQLPPTAKHESSMLQDIKASRGTEIDAMNGEVVRLGDKSGINVKTNRTICNIIKFIEGRYL